MKKLMFLAICLMAAGSVSAQQYPPPRRYPAPRQYEDRRPHRRRPVDDFYQIKFGIVGGVNISNLVNVNNANYSTDTRVGFNIGGSLDIPVVYPFSIEGEVLYSQKGYSAATNYGEFTQRNNFIDVPILAKFKLAPAFNFVVGPQISFLTNTTNVYRDGFQTTYENVYNRNADGYDKTLIGGVIGFGVDLSPNVELRARYTIDLQDNVADTDLSPQYRNQVWQFGLGFKF